MPRDYEFMIAFKRAIQRDTRRRQMVSTINFVKEVELVNWHYPLRAVNQRIETHTTTFRDISPNEGEERLFIPTTQMDVSDGLCITCCSLR